MRKVMKMILCTLLLSGQVINMSAQEIKRTKALADLVNKPVLYQIVGTDKVRTQTEIKYSDTDDPNLLMDVYLPPNVKPGERRPVVFFIHGGAGSKARPKDWGLFRSWGRLIAASGMVAVTFTHRLGFPDPSLKNAFSDVHMAISYVRKNAVKLNADRERICLMAFSAGGPMLSPIMNEKPYYVRCLVAYYAFMDIRQSETHRQYEPVETLKEFSPITRLEKGAEQIPIFLARAGLDAIPTMNDSIDRFINEGLMYNAPLTIMNHPTGIHGFDNQNDDDRSRQIIRSTIEFMKENLSRVKAVKSRKL